MKASPANPGVPLGLAASISICAVLCGCSWSTARESDGEILAIYELAERFTYFKQEDKGDFAQNKGTFFPHFFFPKLLS